MEGMQAERFKLRLTPIAEDQTEAMRKLVGMAAKEAESMRSSRALPEAKR